MLGAGVSPDSRDRDRVANGSLVLSYAGGSKQRASGEPTASASPAVTGPGRAAAQASTGGDRTPMVGMYRHHLLDGPFPLSSSGSHCNHQPQHMSAASSSSSSSPSPTAAGELAGGGERRLLLEALVGEILLRGASGKGGGEVKGRRDLDEMVRWVRELAADPAAPPPAAEAAAAKDVVRERQVLAVRRALYLRMEDVVNAEELPSFSRKRKHKAHNNHEEGRKKKGPSNLPTRKSERLAKKMKLMTSLLLTQRKKIGTGEQFQAEVPEWTGPPSEQDLSDYRNDANISKMLGTRIGPPEGGFLQIENVTVGQGRPEFCRCSYPRSFFCRQHHINVARDQLRSELGQAFSEWGFDSMGEEVSKTWNRDEQLRFNALERLVPMSEHKTFWGVASKYFASKSRVDLLRYYLNVFLMRRVANQCRLNLLEIDSDEDEVEEEDDEDQSEASGSSLRSQNARKNS